jgi:hypothetical protein
MGNKVFIAKVRSFFEHAFFYGKEQTMIGGAVMISQTALRFIIIIIIYCN